MIYQLKTFNSLIIPLELFLSLFQEGPIARNSKHSARESHDMEYEGTKYREVLKMKIEK
jgi:hypothetical protein